MNYFSKSFQVALLCLGQICAMIDRTAVTGKHGAYSGIAVNDNLKQV